MGVLHSSTLSTDLGVSPSGKAQHLGMSFKVRPKIRVQDSSFSLTAVCAGSNPATPASHNSDVIYSQNSKIKGELQYGKGKDDDS